MSITGEHVMADRKARKLSRTAYAALVQLTSTKIHNIEHGRALRPEEEALFAAFFAANPTTEPLPAVGGSPLPPSPPAAPEVDAPAPPTPAAPSSSNGDVAAPVVLLTDDELEDEEGDDPPATSSFGLEAKYNFELPGYHVSNSELSSFRRCKRQWYLAYYREMRLRQPQVFGARALGTRLHIALSAYYSSRREDPWKVLDATLEEDQRILSEGTDVDALTNLTKEGELARIMLEGYLEWLRESGVDEGLEVLGDEEVVEVTFMSPETTPVDQPVALVGKMDLRLRRTYDKARLFLDHKSVGSLTEPLKTLHLDTQMLHYHLLEYLDLLAAGLTSEEAAQEHTMGGLYNMLRKVKRTAAAKPPFFDRVEVRHNIHELRSYYMRVWGEVLQILETRKQLASGQPHQMVAYPHPDRSCAWSCDFLAVCPLMDDGSDWEGLLTEHYEHHDPHDHYYPYGEREVERQDI